MTLLSRASHWATGKLPAHRVHVRLAAPLASFTFDDFPRSAWTTGGKLLEQFGVRSTFYVAGSYCGRTEDGLEYFDGDDLRAVHAAGHEIGCHTYSHQRGPTMPWGALVRDVDRNAAFVRALLGDVVLSSFAYPFGAVSMRTKLLFSRRFPSSRGIRPGVNADVLDLGLLRAVPLESRSWRAATVERLVDATRASNGWLIFFSHDVSASPSPYGCTPAMLEHALLAVKRAGIAVLPVKHALARAVFPART